MCMSGVPLFSVPVALQLRDGCRWIWMCTADLR